MTQDLSVAVDMGEEPSKDVWSGDVEVEHSSTIAEARALVMAGRLGAPSGRKTMIHLVAEWGIAVAAALIGRAVDQAAVWVVVWFVMAWVFAGNAAIMHEAAHSHLFRSRFGNRLLGTAAIAPLFASFATYRAYHWQHHAKTVQEGDPEGTPLSLPSRFVYGLVLLLGGLAVWVENTIYTVLTVVGHPPKWARAVRHRRAIRVNAIVVAAMIGLAVYAMFLDPVVTLEVWLIPAGIATLFLLPMLLLPEHYGATGIGDILSNTRSVKSNPVLRWFFWNTNFHAAHHLAPSVPFHQIQAIEDLLEERLSDPKWRVVSYSAFHWKNITGLAFNRAKPAENDAR